MLGQPGVDSIILYRNVGYAAWTQDSQVHSAACDALLRRARGTLAREARGPHRQQQAMRIRAAFIKDAALFVYDAKCHGSAITARRLFDTCLKDMRRRHPFMRQIEVGAHDVQGLASCFLLDFG